MTKLFKLSTIFISILCVAIGTTYADTTLQPNEKALLALYKASNVEPDFQKMITDSPDFARASTSQDSFTYIEKETNRLKNWYTSYNVDEDFLHVRTNVQTKLMFNQNAASLVSSFPGYETGEIPFFPYQAYEQWVSVVLLDLDKFLNIPIDKRAYTRLQGYLFQNETIYDLQAQIQYKVKDADISKPVQIEDTTQYMMSGEIAYFALVLPDFHQSHDRVLWEYRAPWNPKEKEKNLWDILQERQQ